MQCAVFDTYVKKKEGGLMHFDVIVPKDTRAGGWSGWRPFVVKQKVPESAEITSFYLYPGDEGEVVAFEPGQYVSVRLFLPELNLLQARQYSLSGAPGEPYYRISVKRESGLSKHPDGMISNCLHDPIGVGDAIRLTAPAGNFVLDTCKQTPVVFLSGGVGQTPLVSMAGHLIRSGSKREITWIHGCRNRSVHAFKDITTQWSRQSERFKSYVFYQASDQCPPENGYYAGMVELAPLREEVLRPGADYYLCGPAPFIRKQFGDLVSLGVSKEAIHYEEFGPQVLQLQ